VNPISHPQYSDIVIDADSGVADADYPNMFSYTATIDGKPRQLPAVAVDPANVLNITDTESNAYRQFGTTLYNLRGGEAGPREVDVFSKEMVGKTLLPALSKAPTAGVFGAPVDLTNMVLEVVDDVINVARTGGVDTPLRGNRYLSSEEPILGSKFLTRHLQAGADIVNPALVAAGEAVDAGEIVKNWFQFDFTPEERTQAQKYVSLIGQMAGASALEGKAIAEFVGQLAKAGGRPTAKRIYEAMSELWNTSPKKAAALETAMGTGFGIGMVGTLEHLEDAWPGAPAWAKNLIVAGGGFATPIATMTAANTVWDLASNLPVVKMAPRFLAGAFEGITPSGAERSAARAIQTFGSDWKDRSEVLDVLGHLKLALSQGRGMDRESRIAYTLPQLARSEARILQTQLDEAVGSKFPPKPDEIAIVEARIEELRRFGDFQEGQLATIYGDSGLGSEAYARYSDRMIDNRDMLFRSIDEAVFKFEQLVGGASADGVDPALVTRDWEVGEGTGSYKYMENRLRAIQEGRAGAVSEEALAGISDVYKGLNENLETLQNRILEMTQEKVNKIREGMPPDMSPSDRTNFNEMIRREVEASYMHMDSLEDILWNSIQGFGTPKSNAYTTPDGQDLGPQILIDGVPIGEHFAAKAAALDAGEAENQSKWLWKLAGRTALVEQAAKGAGPDATKVATQENRVAFLQREVDAQDAIVSREQAKLNEIGTSNVETRLKEIEAELDALYLRKGRVMFDRTQAQKELDEGNYADEFQRGDLQSRASQAEERRLEIEEITPLINERNALEESRKGSIDPEGLSESARKAYDKQANVLTNAMDQLDKRQSRLLEAQGKLDITMGAKVTSEGAEVNLADEILDTSALGVQTIDGVKMGRKPQEIQNVISHLKREMAFEQGQGATRNAPKVRAISGMISDLQRAIADPENFSLNIDLLNSARKMTALKKDVFEKGSIGIGRGFDRSGRPRVDFEETIDAMIPPSTTRKTGLQDVRLRELENALSPVVTGENTPFSVTIADDGTEVIRFDPEFSITKYAEEPPPPFEAIRPTDGRSLGFRVAEGTEVTPANIDIVQQTLWSRFQKLNESGFNQRASEKFLTDNEAAIRWLKEASGDNATGFEDLVSAETLLTRLNSIAADELDVVIADMRKNNLFNEGFTEDAFRASVQEIKAQNSAKLAAAHFMDEPDPAVMGRQFLDSYLSPSNKNPKQFLESFLQILRRGQNENGTNPALDGFRLAVGEAITNRALSSSADNTAIGKEAQKLSASLGGEKVTLWDPDKIHNMLENPVMARLLNELYGEHAPAVLRKFAEGAEQQTFVGPSAQAGVRPQDAVSTELIGNIGRMVGTGVANATGIMSNLIAAGVGRRAFTGVLGNLRGKAVQRLILDYLIDPQLGMAAVKKYPTVPANTKEKLAKRLLMWTKSNFIDKNLQRLRNVPVQTPGALYELGDPMTTEVLQPPVLGPVTEAAPEARPTRQVAARPMQPPSAASVLSQVSPVQPLPQQVAAASPTPQALPQTLARLEDVGLPLFANDVQTAKDGGIMSVNCKPRQMVG
jgi:hypothetical protein